MPVCPEKSCKRKGVNQPEDQFINRNSKTARAKRCLTCRGAGQDQPLTPAEFEALQSPPDPAQPNAQRTTAEPDKKTKPEIIDRYWNVYWQFVGRTNWAGDFSQPAYCCTRQREAFRKALTRVGQRLGVKG